MFCQRTDIYEVVKLIYPHVTDILKEMCSDEQGKMKAIPAEQLGSWSRTFDFSKNGTFIGKNYVSGRLLWYEKRRQLSGGRAL